MKEDARHHVSDCHSRLVFPRTNFEVFFSVKIFCVLPFSFRYCNAKAVGEIWIRQGFLANDFYRVHRQCLF